MGNDKLATRNIILIQTENRINRLTNENKLALPKGYAPGNELRAAWLILQETKDKNNQPVLETCSRASIQNALLKTVVKGLSPSRDQVYYIPYGKSLTMMPTARGDISLARRFDSRIADVRANVVYKGDKVEFDVINGQRVITTHKQLLENIGNEITAAYAVAVNHEGHVVHSELMTWKQILAAWKKSPMDPVNEDGSLKKNSTHAQYPEEMSKKTVIHHLCKRVSESATGDDVYEILEAAFAEDAERETGQTEIDVDDDVIDVEPEPEPEVTKPPKDKPEEKPAKPATKKQVEEINAEFDRAGIDREAGWKTIKVKMGLDADSMNTEHAKALIGSLTNKTSGELQDWINEGVE